MNDSLAELRLVCTVGGEWRKQTYHPHGLIPVFGNWSQKGSNNDVKMGYHKGLESSTLRFMNVGIQLY
jgi:hypothetical protein